MLCARYVSVCEVNLKAAVGIADVCTTRGVAACECQHELCRQAMGKRNGEAAGKKKT